MSPPLSSPKTSLDHFITDHLPDDYGRPQHIKWLRLGLAGLAILIILGLIVWPRYREAQISADQPVVENNTGGMQRATLTGSNNNGNPYQIRADRVIPMEIDDPNDQTANNNTELDANRLQLIAPSADITLGDGQWLAVRADTGRFDRLDQQLTLTGDVFVINQDGWSATATTTTIKMATHHLSADGGVTAQSPMGKITAPAMTINDNGDRIRFHGPATLTLTGNHNHRGAS